MIDFFYNRSEPLIKSLSKLEERRRELLVIPLSPKTELFHRWGSMVERIYSILKLSGIKAEKKNVIHILTLTKKKKYKAWEREVVGFKEVCDILYFDWTMSKKAVNEKTANKLFEKLCPGRLYDKLFLGSTIQHNVLLKEIFDYLHKSDEHPVFKAAISYIELLRIAPFQEKTLPIASLISSIFLSKYGYDAKGFISLETYWQDDIAAYRDITSRVLESRNLTLWLEYYLSTYIKQLEKVVTEISSNSTMDDVPGSFWELTDRQKEILSYLSNPILKITNRKAQALFQISQVTAARDLAKLTQLGLLFSHGKGRSVYYTRV